MNNKIANTVNNKNTLKCRYCLIQLSIANPNNDIGRANKKDETSFNRSTK